MACLDVCVAAKYLREDQVRADLQKIDGLVGGIYCLCYRRRA